MPTNVIAGYTLTQVAEETLANLMAQVPVFSAIATDLSANIVDSGDSVVTRIPGTGSIKTLTDYDAQNAELSAITVTLGDPKGCVYGFTDKQFSVASVGDIRRMFIEPSANRIAADINNTILALVTGSVHSNSYSGSIANFGADEISDSVKDLAGYSPTALVLDPSLSNVLRKDVAEYQVIGTDSVIRSGTVGKIYGLDHYQTNGTFKDNILGFACAKNALVFAARTPAIPTNFPGEVVTVQDKSGLSLQLRMFYSADQGLWKMSVGLMYGASRGVNAALRTFIAA